MVFIAARLTTIETHGPSCSLLLLLCGHLLDVSHPWFFCSLSANFSDDSAAHISEEVSGAARVAPIAILVGVGATASLGWLLLIAISFVVPSIPDLLASKLPLPMGQVLLNVLGKRGMLAIWSCIIAVQVRATLIRAVIRSDRLRQFVCGAAQLVDASRVVFAFSRSATNSQN
jgi:amino acid transporter